MDEARFQDDLRRFWDEIARGGPATPGNLDPELAATIRRLHAMRDVPPPNPAYARRLRESIMNATSLPIPFESIQNQIANGLTVPQTGWTLPSARPAPPNRRGWPIGSLATAALLLVTLVASLFAFGPLHPKPEQRLPMIAAVATPLPDNPVEFLWQSRGGPDLPLHDPVQVAMDPRGNIWVTDGRNSRYQIFSPDGEFLEAWGTTGSAPGQFNFVVAPENGGFVGGSMAFDPAGNLYVVDSGNYRIQKFGPDRTFLTAWGSEGEGDGQFIAPSGVAIDQQGRVYVGEEARDDVQVFDSDGRFLTAWGDPDKGWLDNPSGIAVDAEGNLWIAHLGANRVQKYAPDGTLLATIGEYGSGPGQLRPGQLVYPSGVAIDDLGRIYVSSWGGGHVLVFDEEGQVLARWGKYGFREGEVTATNGVLLDGLGNVYIAEDGSDQLMKFRLLPPLAP